MHIIMFKGTPHHCLKWTLQLFSKWMVALILRLQESDEGRFD